MLMKLRKNLKKGRNKGFTLVEVIVVLVIIAILAAIAIPALTGYIEKANEKAVLSQTRSAVVAAQTIVSDGYGEGATIDQTWVDAHVTSGAVQRLSGDTSIVDVKNVKVNVGNAVESLEITTSSGRTGLYDASSIPPYSAN